MTPLLRKITLITAVFHRFPSLIGALLATAATAPAAEPNIRVCVQLIEVSHPDLTKILAAKDDSGPALHRAATALIRSGKAKLVDSSIVTAVPGNRATVESIQERIYPTEYEPGGLGSVGGPATPAYAICPLQVGRPAISYAWDTRNVGMTFEIETNWDEDQRVIDLRMLPEWVGLAEMVPWVGHVDEWGDASDRKPTFITLRTNTSTVLSPGQFAFITVLTPQVAPPAPQLDRQILLFVRADIPKQ